MSDSLHAVRFLCTKWEDNEDNLNINWTCCFYKLETMHYFTCDFPYEKTGSLIVKFKNSVTRTNQMLQVKHGNVNQVKFAIPSTNIWLNIRETPRTTTKKAIQLSRYCMYCFFYILLKNIFIHVDLESFHPSKSFGAHKVHIQWLKFLIVNGDKYDPPKSNLAYCRSALPSGKAHLFALTAWAA